MRVSHVLLLDVKNTIELFFIIHDHARDIHVLSRSMKYVTKNLHVRGAPMNAFNM